MKAKQIVIPNKLKSVKNNSQLINGSSVIKHTSSRIANKQETARNQLLLRLSELEETNVLSEIMIQEGKKTLSEVVATNAKFLSIVAHDLRNPFNTIIGILDILDHNFDEFSKPELEKLIHLASNSALQTLELLDSLIKWSVSQNIERSFNPVKVNLRELIINEFKGFKVSASQKQVMMNHSIATDLHVTADIQMVKTIFRNLISNAVKYSNNGGNIFISGTEGNRFVEIEVRDNGIGISENTQRKLFKTDEFHSRLGTDNEQGTGLGLLFCKEFIEMHGGEIWAESESGKGSKFKFTLPHYL